MMTKPKRRVLGYIRVSTQEQVEGFGLDAQERAIRQLCKRKDWRLVGVLRDEGESGANGLDARQGLAEALARVERGEAAAIVVYRLDRLARDLLLQLTIGDRLQRADAEIVSVSEPEVDGPDELKTLIRNILGSISAYERAVIRGRMMAGKQAKRARGGYVGGQPRYGTRADGGELTRERDEERVVATVKRLRARGRSYREICTELEHAGLRPRRAAAWQPAVVRRIAER